MTSLVDTSVLLHAYDPRSVAKRRIAALVVHRGIVQGDVYLPLQAVLEMVAYLTQPQPELPDGRSLLTPAEAYREADELMRQLRVVLPNEDTARLAMRTAGTYGLSWWQANLLACAEHYGIPTVLSEDFEHERHYGPVRTFDPFQPVDTVHETVARYG